MICMTISGIDLPNAQEMLGVIKTAMNDIDLSGIKIPKSLEAMSGFITKIKDAATKFGIDLPIPDKPFSPEIPPLPGSLPSLPPIPEIAQGINTKDIIDKITN